MKIKHVAVLMAAAWLMLACGGKKVAVQPKGTDQELYQQARKYLRKDPERARTLFKEIIHLYPDSVYSRRAKVGIGDAYFHQKDSASLIMAASEYQEFVSLYPNSPDAVYAKHQVALCFDRQVRKPGRDQTQTFKAIEAHEAVVSMFPDTEEAQQSQQRIKELRLNLAEHFFRIGYYNYRFRAYKGAVNRFKQVMDEYPDFKSQDRLFYYTGASYLALREYDTALSFFQRLVDEYPQSSLARKGRKMIQAMPRLRLEGEKYKQRLSRWEKKQQRLQQKYASQEGEEKSS